MEPSLVLLVLLAALLHASWNALLKLPGDALTKLALINMTGVLVALPLLPWVAMPAPASWPFLLGSVAVHACYYLCLVLAYREGDLSLVYPVARGVAPLLVAVGAWLVAGERLSTGAMLSIMVISAGILTLGISGLKRAPAGAMVFALGTGATIVCYTIIDGLGARASGSPVGYIAWLFVADGVPISVAAFLLRRRMLARTLRQSWAPGLAAGLCAITAYGVVIWAMTKAPMTYVSALRETSVVLAALIGTRILREPFGLVRVSAAVVVAAGIAGLQLSP